MGEGAPLNLLFCNLSRPLNHSVRRPPHKGCRMPQSFATNRLPLIVASRFRFEHLRDAWSKGSLPLRKFEKHLLMPSVMPLRMSSSRSVAAQERFGTRLPRDWCIWRRGWLFKVERVTNAAMGTHAQATCPVADFVIQPEILACLCTFTYIALPLLKA